MQLLSFKQSRGVSLVEVIFSIGVIIIGILGVMSILPLAGRRAQDSVSMSVGAAMGNSVVGEILSNRWNQKWQLRILTPPDFPSPYTEAAVRTYIDAPVSPYNYTETTFTLPVARPVPNNQPFCIDPMLIRSNTTVTRLDDQSGFNTLYFPYYKPTHNPEVDPSILGASQLVERGGAAPLRRLIRVGLLRGPSDTAALPRGSLLSASEAFHVGERVDDIRFTRPKDRTLPAIISGERATEVAGSTNYGTRFGKGDYSWFATVVPEQTRGYATLSVVIVRNRLRDFDIPSSFPATIPERNASAERLATVTSATGFVGGAGGMVTISSNLNTVSRMLPGHWVMLSSFTGSQFPVHRWYRIASLGGDVVINEAAGRWERNIQLDGADWEFSPTVPTQMTIVDGAVSVTNHFVRLDAL